MSAINAVETGFHELGAKRLNMLDRIDAMPNDLRAVVHEFGLPIVEAFGQFGVTDANVIRHLVHQVWLGARQNGQRAGMHGALDVTLARGVLNTVSLYRFLFQQQMALVPISPTRAMIDASMAEVSGGNVRVTKEQKHIRRLRAAIRAEMNLRLGRIAQEQSATEGGAA